MKISLFGINDIGEDKIYGEPILNKF